LEQLKKTSGYQELAGALIQEEDLVGGAGLYWLYVTVVVIVATQHERVLDIHG